MPKVFVAHPGRQHSHQLAWALEDAGLLGFYLHGSPLPRDAKAAIPARKRLMVPLASAGRRGAALLSSSGHTAQIGYRLDRAFDAFAARVYSRLDNFDAVAGYENGCANLMQEARRQRQLRILDAASVHHEYQDRMAPYLESDAFHKGVIDRKNREIALADEIITCSRFASATYANAGVPTGKLRIVPLGTDTSASRARIGLSAPPSGPTRFLFVGRLREHKGCDILAGACRQLASQHARFTITIVADRKGGNPELFDGCEDFSTWLEPMPQTALADVYRRNDCLILPSRFDSYGLVVPEALSHGCAAIVSTGAGASMLIEDGRNGFVFPNEDIEALSVAMQSVIMDIDLWRQERSRIMEASSVFDWIHYRNRVGALIGELLAKRSPGSV